MVKIGELNLFVGRKEERDEAVRLGMSIVCAMNTGYREIMGGKTDPDHPDYLFKRMGNKIYLNLIDGKDGRYVQDKLIDAAMDFIDQNLQAGKKVFLYCSLGESRSPSIALMYGMEQGIFAKSKKGVDAFYNIYPWYKPGDGMWEYLSNRYLLKKKA